MNDESGSKALIATFLNNVTLTNPVCTIETFKVIYDAQKSRINLKSAQIMLHHNFKTLRLFSLSDIPSIKTIPIL